MFRREPIRRRKADAPHPSIGADEVALLAKIRRETAHAVGLSGPYHSPGDLFCALMANPLFDSIPYRRVLAAYWAGIADAGEDRTGIPPARARRNLIATLTYRNERN